MKLYNHLINEIKTNNIITVKLLNFQTKRFYHGVMPPNVANGIANSEEPDDQSDFAQTCLFTSSVTQGYPLRETPFFSDECRLNVGTECSVPG